MKKRLFAGLLACVLVATGMNYTMPVTAANQTAMSASEIVADMGLGWNLGNALDAYYDGLYVNNIYSYETSWGNPQITKELVDTVHNKGFDTIRIPVTWYPHMSNDGKYTIDDEWFDRVEEVVNYAYQQDMYVILNIHHEEWINRADFATSEAAMETELRAVWTQIATRFANYDQHLIFEGMNEPRAAGTDLEWTGGNAECRQVVNQLNAAFVETVRNVSSPYQGTRLLMVPGYAASVSSDVYSCIIVPKATNSIDQDNDGDDDYVAVSIHAYSPYNFAMGDGPHDAFSASVDTELTNIFNGIRTTFTAQDIPVVIGEFSASNYGYDDARCAWATRYITLAKEAGIPCVLWDNNKDNNGGNSSEAHGYLNRSTLTWYTSGNKVVTAMTDVIKDNTNVVFGSKKYIAQAVTPDFSTATNVNFSVDADNSVVLNKSNLKNFGTGKELAIRYTKTAPSVGLMDSGWNGWTTLTLSSVDSSNQIGYLTYDDIKTAFGSENFQYIKLIPTGDGTCCISNISIVDVPTLQSYALYVQTAASDLGSGYYDARYVELIPESLAEMKSSVTFTFTYNNEQVAITSKKCYTSITVGGEALTAPDGYVYVACILQDIPSRVPVSGDNAIKATCTLK